MKDTDSGKQIKSTFFFFVSNKLTLVTRDINLVSLNSRVFNYLFQYQLIHRQILNEPYTPHSCRIYPQENYNCSYPSQIASSLSSAVVFLTSCLWIAAAQQKQKSHWPKGLSSARTKSRAVPNSCLLAHHIQITFITGHRASALRTHAGEDEDVASRFQHFFLPVPLQASPPALLRAYLVLTVWRH